MNNSNAVGGLKQTDTSEMWSGSISISTPSVIAVKRAHLFCVGELLGGGETP